MKIIPKVIFGSFKIKFSVAAQGLRWALSCGFFRIQPLWDLEDLPVPAWMGLLEALCGCWRTPSMSASMESCQAHENCAWGKTSGHWLFSIKHFDFSGIVPCHWKSGLGSAFCICSPWQPFVVSLAGLAKWDVTWGGFSSAAGKPQNLESQECFRPNCWNILISPQEHLSSHESPLNWHISTFPFTFIRRWPQNK